MKKVILHISQTDIRTDSRILKEMKSLVSAGYQVNAIGVDFDEGTFHDKEVRGIKIESVTIKSKKIKFLPKIIVHALCMTEMILRMYFRGAKVKPNIVHCHDTLALPLGFIFKLFNGVKLIYDAHELESNKNSMSKVESKVTLLVEKFIWPLIDALIVVSPSIDRWYQNNIGEKLSAVILNSPEVNNNEVVDNKYLRNKFSIPSDKKIFIYVGILNSGRGIDIILDYFSKNQSSHVVFLGYGDLSDNINHASEKFTNIHLHKAVEHSNVVDIIRTADCGLCLIQNVSLSDYYCLPNKLFEYTFSGLTVLASDFPDIREVVEKYELGCCVDLTYDSISDGVRRIESGCMVRNIHIEELSDLTWDAQSKKLVELYSNF